MNFEHLFPPSIELNNAELHQIAVAFQNPAVRKYLLIEGRRLLSDISAAFPLPDESDATFLRRRAIIAGATEVYNTLLSIEAPASEFPSR